MFLVGPAPRSEPWVRTYSSRMPGEAWLTFPDGTEHMLTETITIGRDSDNDLTFHSRSVSRDHAALCLEDGRWYVEDRGSLNGTHLNGTRLQAGARLPLRHADRIGIGKESVLFSCPSQLRDPETTEPLEEVPPADVPQLSTFQRQVVAALCGPWLAGGSPELLPSNE